MELVLDIVSGVLLILGAVVVVIGSVGLLRMPDVMTQLHAAGTTDTLGAALIVMGLVVQAGFSLLALKLLVILFFLLFTNPSASHALSRAYRHYQDRPWKERQEGAGD
jgi:multicomponent Na+:H+ antiporter subunit G